MEEPAFDREAGDLNGLSILDLGCGDGRFGLAAFERGCRSYTGIDGSALMLDRARTLLAGTPAELLHVDLEDLPTLELHGSFGLVASRMTLHYVADLAPVLRKVCTVLTQRGRLIMSVVHPVITSHENEIDGPRTAWTVDDYFRTGTRERQWFGATVTWYHRTIEDYLDVLSEAGFELVALREAEPVASLFGGATDELERRRRVPLFLVLHARRR